MKFLKLIALVKPKADRYTPCMSFRVWIMNDYFSICLYTTGYTQKNGTVSKVNKKFISQICDYSARISRCTVITDLDTSKRNTQKVFSCCEAILETGPAVSMRSELLVAHEKLGQLPLLTVYVVPV